MFEKAVQGASTVQATGSCDTDAQADAEILSSVVASLDVRDWGLFGAEEPPGGGGDGGGAPG